MTAEERDREAGRAAFYALYLRLVVHLDPDEAAELVKQRYPRAKFAVERDPEAHAARIFIKPVEGAME